MKKYICFVCGLFLLTSHSVFADFNNCNNYLGQTGYVDTVSVGKDDSNANYISFSMKINNKNSGDISVKQVLTESAGKAMLDLLLVAARTQELFTIDRCYSNQLAGGSIKVR